jgi:hypothetical protein
LYVAVTTSPSGPGCSLIVRSFTSGSCGPGGVVLVSGAAAAEVDDVEVDVVEEFWL